VLLLITPGPCVVYTHHTISSGSTMVWVKADSDTGIESNCLQGDAYRTTYREDRDPFLILKLVFTDGPANKSPDNVFQWRDLKCYTPRFSYRLASSGSGPRLCIVSKQLLVHSSTPARRRTAISARFTRLEMVVLYHRTLIS
jgi:hypothetical protein